MPRLPASTLDLFDSNGAPIGTVRLVLNDAVKGKGDCIFDMAPLSDDARDETRWLYKRRFKRQGEHRFVIDDEGVVTITGPDFRLVLDPVTDEELRARPPMPQVTAWWGEDDEE